MKTATETKNEILGATEQMEWRVHTPSLLREVLNNHGSQALAKPIQIFGQVLSELTQRAIELNDPELNTLMARLTLYDETDPYSTNFSKEITDKLLSFKK